MAERITEHERDMEHIDELERKVLEMAERICARCKHWSVPEWVQKYLEAAFEHQPEPPADVSGPCSVLREKVEAVLHHPAYAGGSYVEALDAGGSYVAALETDGDFGCVLWEERDDG